MHSTALNSSKLAVFMQYLGNYRKFSVKVKTKSIQCKSSKRKISPPQVISNVPLLPRSAEDRELLSLIQPLPVSPVISRSLEMPSTPSNDLRFLKSVRLGQQFDKGRELLLSRGGSLSPAGGLEAGRLLLEAGLFCQESAEDQKVAGKILTRVKAVNLPPALAFTTELVLTAVSDPNAAFSTLNSPNGDALLYRTELLSLFACLALKEGRWDALQSILKSLSSVEIMKNPLFFFWLLRFIDSGKLPAGNVTRWYLDSLVEKGTPILHHDFHNFFSRLFRVSNARCEKVEIDRNGLMHSKKRKLSVPSELPITKKDLASLKRDFRGWVDDLAKQGGSLTTYEISRLEKAVADWKKSKVDGSDSAVVVDTLNVTHGLGQMRPFMTKLAKEFGNVLMVTRPFQVDRLKAIKCPGNIHVFPCDSLSEDDLITLLAAFQWGPTAYVLSNDHFGAHVERLKCTGSLSLQEWIQKRVMRYDKIDMRYSIPTYFAQNVVRVDGFYVLPVVQETSEQPRLTHWLVTL